MTTTHRPTDPIGADLLHLLKTLKLGALADTLPERAALARQHKLSHIGFPRNPAGRRGLPTRIPLRGTTSDQSRTRPHHAV